MTPPSAAPARPRAASRGMLGPVIILAVLGICSGSLAVYLTLRVPRSPVPEPVQQRLDAIQSAIGPAAAPTEPPAVQAVSPSQPGRPRSVDPTKPSTLQSP